MKLVSNVSLLSGVELPPTHMRKILLGLFVDHTRLVLCPLKFQLLPPRMLVVGMDPIARYVFFC